MEPNVKLSFLSKLQTLDEIQTGNGYTTIEIIGNENEEGKRYVKKTIFLNNQNAHYAYMQRTMMQIIDSEYVLKLLQWEQISQTNRTNRTASKIKQMQTAKPGIPKKLVLYMDYCQKGDLKRHLIQENPQIQTRIQIFLDILYAMRFLHQKFIIHRDMKLENIFITHDHQIKIADLGFASQTLSLAQTKVGTFGEEAPEVFIEAQEGYSDKVDVWSIGYLGFQILNKPCEFQVFKKEFIRDPYLPKEKLKRKVIEFGNQNMKEFYFKIFESNFLFFTPQVPKSLKYLISQMLKADPAKRISFRQIYSSKYLQNLREELGGQKVQKMKNFPSLEKDYQQIYSAIQINKKQIHQNERIYSQLYQKIYEPLVQKIFQQNSLKLTTNQEANDLLKVFYLTMRRMKAIYKEISDKKLINMKKKFQQCDKKVSQKIIPVRNSLELYLKSQGKHPIQSNQDLLSADYFENLLKKVSINHNLNVQAIIK